MNEALPQQVKIVEVGPRDGLQNEKAEVSMEDRIAFIDALADAGCKHIETGAFVSPKWVPQMAGSAEVFRGLQAREGVVYSALVPNERGLEAALEAGVREIAVFAAASETFSQKNINCSISESLRRFEPVISRAREGEIKVRGYVSTVVDCPYEGSIAPEAVEKVARLLLDMGCYEISLGETIGTATPLRIQTMLETVTRTVPVDQLAAHYHDTHGMAIANIFASLQLGVAVIDASAGGLGGCPYAPGAAGNVATERVLYLLDGMGIEHGIDRERLEGIVPRLFPVIANRLKCR